MKTKKTEQINMFNSLTRVMENSKKIWTKVNEIEKTYKIFLDGTNKLNLLKEEYDKDNDNLVDKKSVARKSLINEAFPISNVILAFAIENGHKGLEKRCSITKEKMKGLKDSKLLDFSKSIWKEAKKLYNHSVAAPEPIKENPKSVSINIHNYGLTGQMIDKLEIANVALIEARLELKDAINYKEKCKKKISLGIKENLKMLENKLDLLLTIFKSSDPSFYADYLAARMIKKAEADKVKAETPKTKKTETKTVTKPVEQKNNTKKVTESSVKSPEKKVVKKPVVAAVSKVENAKVPVKKEPVKIASVKKAPVKKAPVVKTPARKASSTRTAPKTTITEKKEVSNESSK